MPRPPKDDVAASTTITLRLTPDDRQRIERQVEARAAELPERSMSALLRRLVRDADDDTGVRLPPEERTLLDRLVAHRIEELARLGVEDEAHVTPSSVLARLVREAARAKGLASSAPQAGAAATPPPAEAPAPTAPKRAAPLAADDVQAALIAATEGGTTQADIARKTGIDSGHLSRFKRQGTGLSPENLEKLAEALGMRRSD